jgi:hypothetical protein
MKRGSVTSGAVRAFALGLVCCFSCIGIDKPSGMGTGGTLGAGGGGHGGGGSGASGGHAGMGGQGGGSCELNGVTYPADGSGFPLGGFPCGDGCNTCWCMPQGILSTAVACNVGGKAGGGGGGGAGGHGGVGGSGGAGGHGGAGPCHTNADCSPSWACLIRAPITDCASAPAGECVQFAISNCSLAGLHGPCDCFGGESRSGCSATYPGTQCNGSTNTFGADYRTPTSCFGCYPVPASQ